MKLVNRHGGKIAEPGQSSSVRHAGSKPGWLERARVLGSLGLAGTETKGYEAYMEGRVLELASRAGRKGLDQPWKALRRGWCVGGPTFAEKLAEKLQPAVQGRHRESHSGPARLAHDQAAAEQRLGQGMRVLGLDQRDLDRLPKGAPEKLVLAWWLRQHTTVTLRWVSHRLAMGHYTRVTQAIRRMSHRPGGELQKLKGQMVRLGADPAPLT
jgi:hypothetical protein